MNKHVARSPSPGGFTLVEIAVVLFIVGLLIAGVVGPLETQLEARDRRETIDTMDEVVEALYGFAITRGYLPCPDVTGDGVPDPEYDPANIPLSGFCQDNGAMGFVPWQTLNVPQGDAWGNRIRYRVTPLSYTLIDADGVCDGTSPPPGEFQEFDLCATGDITVRTRGDNPASTGSTEGKFRSDLATSLPAVILSTGRNGLGGISVNGIARASAPGSTDEAENTDNDAIFVSRGYSAESGSCADTNDESSALCAFDDIIKWVSPAILNNRMVTAGRLP